MLKSSFGVISVLWWITRHDMTWHNIYKKKSEIKKIVLYHDCLNIHWLICCGSVRGSRVEYGTVKMCLRCLWLIGSELSQPLSDSVIIKSSQMFKEQGAQALLVPDCIGASCIDCIDPPIQTAGLAGTLQSERDGEISLPLRFPSFCFYSECH